MIVDLSNVPADQAERVRTECVAPTPRSGGCTAIVRAKVISFQGRHSIQAMEVVVQPDEQ